MAKRFTDSEKWNKSFIRSMKAPYKLLWIYILDECNHAGIWSVDFDVAEIKIGEKLNKETAIHYFKDKVLVFDNGEKWLIYDYIDFQYGELNPENRVHKSVINLLDKYKIDYKNKGLVSPLQGATYKDKDKDKDKDSIYRKFLHLNITINEFEKLCQNWDKEIIDKVLDRIQNYSKNKKYTSLYLTALDWLKKDYPIPEKKEHPYTDVQIKQAQTQVYAGYGVPEWFDKEKFGYLINFE